MGEGGDGKGISVACAGGLVNPVSDGLWCCCNAVNCQLLRLGEGALTLQSPLHAHALLLLFVPHFLGVYRVTP